MSKRLREVVNVDALKRIADNVEEFMVEEERKRFKRYTKLMSTGSKFTEYSQSKHGKGRMYAAGADSMQFLSKSLKVHLAAGLYHDIDMVNCHPVFLLSVCKDNGWRCPKLKHYIEHREQVLKDIVRFIMCTRADAKVLMLRLTFGGTVKKWKKDLGKSRAKLPPFIGEYVGELKMLVGAVNLIYKEYPAPKKRNPHYSRLSILLQDMEHRVLLIMSAYFALNGYEPGVYMFDGLMVHKNGTAHHVPRTLLDGCQKEIMEKTGWMVMLEEKPI